MVSLIATIIFAILASVLFFWQFSLIVSAISGAPTVHSRNSVILESFKTANLKKDETVLDLGCSDARALILAVNKFGAKGVGIEISPFYYLKAKLNVISSGQANKIRIVFGNLKKNIDLVKKSDVLYLYLFPKLLDEIEKEIFGHLRQGARIISVGFKFKNHKNKLQKSTISGEHETKIYLYQV